jgi:site-specific DNA recombinase
VNSLDRSSRSPKDFFNFLDELQQRQIELISVTEKFDTTTAMGKAFLYFRMIIASLESDLASDRTSETIAYWRTLGLHWGNNPYGYDRDDAHVLIPNEDAPVVVLLCELYATGKYSYENLAAELNVRGHRFRDRIGRQRPWARPHVRSVLSNLLIYLGYIPEGRGKDRRVEKVPGLTLVDSMIEVVNAIPGRHEPLLSLDLAERCLRVRQQRSKLKMERKRHQYLLTGIACCAHCDVPLRGQPARRQEGKYVYRHTGQRSPACDGGTGFAVDADLLEAKVLDLLAAIALPPTLQAAVRAIAQKRLASTPGYDEHQAVLRRLESKLERLKLLFVEGDISQEEYRRGRDEARLQIAERQYQIGTGPYDVDAVLANADRLGKLIRHGSRLQQRQAIMFILEHVAVDLATGEIERAQPREWFRLLLQDLDTAIGDGDKWCPQGNSNPCRSLERAVS